MRFTQHILMDNLGVGIEIVGNIAALVIRDVSFGHHNRDKVLILDWKRGIVRAVRTGSFLLLILSLNYV